MKNTLQTLDRGLIALDLISQSERGMTVSELAEALSINRAIAYRIANTLEHHGLITRMKSGHLRLGAAAVLFSYRFQPQFREIARPLLIELAHHTAATAFISIAQGDYCYVIMVEEPKDVFLQVAYRIGSQHPLDKGAAGIAILSGRAPQADDNETVLLAREQGYSLTQGVLQKGAIGVAAPIPRPSPALIPESSVGVVAMEGLDTELAAQAVIACAQHIAKKLAL